MYGAMHWALVALPRPTARTCALPQTRARMTSAAFLLLHCRLARIWTGRLRAYENWTSITDRWNPPQPAWRPPCPQPLLQRLRRCPSQNLSQHL